MPGMQKGGTAWRKMRENRGNGMGECGEASSVAERASSLTKWKAAATKSSRDSRSLNNSTVRNVTDLRSLVMHFFHWLRRYCKH